MVSESIECRGTVGYCAQQCEGQNMVSEQFDSVTWKGRGMIAYHTHQGLEYGKADL